MTNADLILHSTRSQKFSCIVPSKDCLSNSAAAADWFDEQRFSFYRRTARAAAAQEESQFVIRLDNGCVM